MSALGSSGWACPHYRRLPADQEKKLLAVKHTFVAGVISAYAAAAIGAAPLAGVALVFGGLAINRARKREKDRLDREATQKAAEIWSEVYAAAVATGEADFKARGRCQNPYPADSTEHYGWEDGASHAECEDYLMRNPSVPVAKKPKRKLSEDQKKKMVQGRRFSSAMRRRLRYY